MHNLDPKAVWLFFISFVFRWVFTAVFVIVYFGLFFISLLKSMYSFNIPILLWVIVPFTILFSWIWAKLSYKYYKYELREDGFRKESGVIWKAYVTIPYDRIQNVDIYRGLIARILGLSDLNIQTAGASAQVSRYGVWGGSAEGRLLGVSAHVAETLRDELIQRSRKSRENNKVL